MKAMYLTEKAGAESLVSGELPQPQPGAGEVLVRVHATAITPTELEWFPTFSQPSGQPRPFPIVLSHEFSGVVEALGAGVENVRAGDTVYGLNDWFANGAQAEFCVASASALAPKPGILDHARASVVPISALTAWQALYEKAGVTRGHRVLIHGGAGGVGLYAVQLARRRGAYVIATASAGNLDFVRTLGAAEAIDYRALRFEDLARDMDVVFDTVGGETLDRSWAVLKPGGKLITVAVQGPSADQRAKDAFMLVRADGTQLAEIAALIDAGELLVFCEAEFPLSEAREAYGRARRGGMRGKIALRVVR